MARKHTSVHQYSHTPWTPMTVIPKNTRTDKYYITINNNDKQSATHENVNIIDVQYASVYIIM